MDWYSLFKFLHVASAITWVGGGLSLVALGIAAERTRDNEAIGRIVGQVIFLTPRMFIPAAVAAFVFGSITAWFAWSLNDLWIWIGLVGFATTFLMGLFVLKPRADAIGKITAVEGYSDRAAAMGRELLSHAKFDYVMLFTVVADMIFKPSIRDWPLLVVFAIAVAGAAVLFLLPTMRKTQTIAARAT